MGALHQGIEIGNHPVPELDGIPDISGTVPIHPGFGYRIVRVHGVHGKPGLENAVLHPSYHQLSFRGRSVKASDISALVGNAGQAHAQDGGYVILKRLPAGQVIPCPGLGIPLDSCVSGTADDEWPGIIKGFPHGLRRYMAHDVSHGSLHLAYGSPFSLKITAAVFINQAVIFAVIVPHRAGPHLQD